MTPGPMVSAGPGPRLGLIHNPRSQRNKAAAAGARRAEAERLGIRFADPASPAALEEALVEFARAAVGVVIVDGGDGTLREVLTALPAAYGTGLPAVAILASGKTNLVAAALGSAGHGTAGLRRLAGLARSGEMAGTIRPRPVLRIEWPDRSHPPVNGLFLGAAAFTRAVGLAQEAVHRRGVTQGPAVLLTIAGSLFRALSGRAGGWRAGEPLAVALDGMAPAAGDRLVFLATTLDRLMLGLWPFWGSGPGPVRFLDVAARPRRLSVGFWRALRGRPAPWMADDYRSGLAGEITLTLARPFILDGEAFDADADGRIRISAGPEIGFLTP